MGIPFCKCPGKSKYLVKLLYFSSVNVPGPKPQPLSMKKIFVSLTLLLSLATGSLVLSSFVEQPHATYAAYKFPWKQAGLTEREAAAHLLSRFSYGARPGDIDRVSKMGLENWFEVQLQAAFADDSVSNLLEGYESLTMSNEQIVAIYPRPASILRRAVQAGAIDKDSVKLEKKESRQAITEFMKKEGLKPQAELIRQLINQKIIRAAYSDNQLREVMTDFWFNHFNVSLTKGEDRQFITVYERDAIRPHVFGKFETLLLKTAQSPAMLTYLDNFRSTGVNEEMQEKQQKRQERMQKAVEKRQANNPDMQKNDVAGKIKKAKENQGLNENYAREIMELHTLGVDGGYTQSDVTQAARILTGWTVYPMGEYGGGGKAIEKLIERIGEDKFRKQGFMREGDFLFAANRHDDGDKTVLGTAFPAGGGYGEGLKLIHLLSTHRSTAQFISKKLATRFASDNPSQSLVDKMAKTFLDKEGSIREVLLTMVNAPEFWSKASLREKTKSPFELAISSVRSLNARVDAPYQLYNWITRMGQQIYYYQAPTGFPDRGQYWINTGSLLNRMNFGLALASGRIPGVRVDLAALNDYHEPESPEQALATYAKILLPERSLDETVKRLQPMLQDPELEQKLEAASSKAPAAKQAMHEDDEDPTMMREERKKEGKPGKKGGIRAADQRAMSTAQGNNSMLAQVVGVILGSPEFQRR